MRLVLKYLVAFVIGTAFLIGCGQDKSELNSSSKPFVSDGQADGVLLKDVIDINSSDVEFAEIGHKFLTGLTPVELMDCSIDNFLMARIITENPSFFEGDPEALLADTVVLDGVFRNALLGAGYDTEEKRQSIYSDTTLAKLVVTNSGATEQEILAAKGKVEAGCRSAIGRAYSKFEAALNAAEASK